MGRLRRLAVDAIAAMPDDELARATGVSTALAPALRGARTLVEAREIARQVLEPVPVSLPPGTRPTLERFAELRHDAPDELDEAGARAVLRDLRAGGGDLRALRLALTGAERGPELWAVVAALSGEDATGRVRRALERM
jgi:hypothetical protein